MRCLVATADVRGQDPGGAVAVLRDLGSQPLACGFDLDELTDEDLGARPPVVILVEAGDRLTTGAACLRRLRAMPELLGVPALLVVATSQIPALDFTLADDFALAPLVPAELYARIRQLDWRTSAFAGEERIKLGSLVIDLAGHEAHAGGRALALTPKEFSLLEFLVRHAGRAFSRDQLLARVWGSRYDGGARTVDIHVRRLREKLGARDAAMIATVRNVGYKLVRP